MGNASGKPQAKSRNKKQVRWKAADRPAPPGKPQLVPGNDVTPDVVTIRWDKPISDGGAPITGYLVEHRRTGSPHWVRATPLIVPNNEVSLSGLEPGWRYQFRVSAENAVGLSDPGELSEPLTVTLQRSAVTAPRFTEELKDTVAIENEKAEFIAHFLGQPPPKVCWFKDGFEIFSSRRTRITTENDRSVLTFYQSALCDEGEIKCTATNRAGHASTKAKLTLEAPPSIRLPRQYEEGLLFELDEVMKLKVSVAGRPTPLVFWSHNGESVQNDEHYEIENTEKSSALRVATARRTDRGEYQIRAVNKLGEDIQSFLVTVTDKPLPPGKARVIMTLGRSVTISWGMPEDDGGCKIGNYIVEYYRIGWNVWLKAATCRQLTTILGDLIEGSEYKFRIKAESPFGVSEPSEESEVVFIPDPKRGILMPPTRVAPKVVQEEPPIATRRKPKPAPRSHSSSRVEERHASPPEVSLQVPPRPARIKSPQRTPESSPAPVRRSKGGEIIDRNVFDRSSLARELAYGSPEIKIKRTDVKPPSPDIPLAVPLKEVKANNVLAAASSQVQKPTSIAAKTETKPNNVAKTANLTKTTTENASKPSNNVAANTLTTPEKSGVVPLPDIRNRRSKSPSPQDIFLRKFSETESKINAALNSKPRSPSLSAGPRENEDSIHGSSEFMLVLYSHDDENKKDHGSTSDMGFEFEYEIVIPPPMSLSAPELGMEPPPFVPLRTSVSSTELLHERAMARFYQAVEAEEAEIQKRREQLEKSERRKSADGRIIEIPKIQIIDEDPTGLERTQSLRRRLSGGGGATAQQILHAQQKRQSLKNSGDLTDVPENKLHKFPDTLEARRELMMMRQRSASEEKEEEEFEKLRKKMAEKTKEDEKAALVSQKKIDVAPLEVWEPEPEEPELEYEESISSEESEEESEDERLKYEKTVPDFYVPDEEDIYHPRLMIPRQSMPTKNKNDEPFEILTKPNPLPDPNFVPKPILKRRPNLDEIANKDAHKVKKISPHKEAARSLSPVEAPAVKNKPSKLSPQKDSDKTHSPEERLSPKPNKQLEPQKISPKRPEKPPEMSSEQLPEEVAPPIKRGGYGHADSMNVSAASTFVGMSAAGVALGKPIQNNRNIDEENRTVIDHYADLVRTYAYGKKPPTKSYLDRAELKAESEEEEEEEQQQIDKAQARLQQQQKLKKETTVVEIAYTPVITKKEASYTNETLVKLQESDIQTLEENRTRSPSPQKPLIKKPLETLEKVMPLDPPAKTSRDSGSQMDSTFAVQSNARRRSSSERSQEASSSQEILSVGRPAGRRPGTPAKKEQMRRSATPIRAETSKRSATPIRAEPSRRVVPPSPMRTEKSYSRPSSTAPSPMRSERTGGYTRTPSSSAQRKTNASPARLSASTSAFKSNSLPRPPMLKEMTTQTSIGYESIGLSESRTSTPQERQVEIQTKAVVKVRTVVDYTSDLAMFIVACWLYLFSNELLAIPVLAVMGYRQLKDEMKDRMPLWLKRKIYGADDK